MSTFNRANGLPTSNDDLSSPNYGINLTNPTHRRDCAPVGAPAMVALKMAVDGTLIVLDVSPAMGEARGRRVADLGYAS